MRKRAGALYIVNKELLPLSEGNQGFFLTPGGGLDGRDMHEQALARELGEELHATLHKAQLYTSMRDPEADEHVQYFLVDMPCQDIAERCGNDSGTRNECIQITG